MQIEYEDNFQSVEVVNRGSETQLQLIKKKNQIVHNCGVTYSLLNPFTMYDVLYKKAWIEYFIETVKIIFHKMNTFKKLTV